MDTLTYTTAAILLVLFVLYKRSWRSNLDHIPAVGYSGSLSSYISAYRYLRYGREMIQEGYDKYHHTMFRVPQMDKWVVVVSGSQLVNELGKSRDEDISHNDAAREIIKEPYTLGAKVSKSHYHVGVVRTPLTRNLGAQLEVVYDELAQAFSDALPFKGDEWISVPGMTTIIEVICRTSNRFFVGLPLCRDPDYKALNIEYTISIMKAAALINLFPRFLQPIVGPLFSPIKPALKRASKHLIPLIEERLENEAKFGEDWAERPNDLLTWLLSQAPEDRKNVHDLTMRVLLLNFGAIHTSSLAFTHALFHLAANPEYAQPMREEAEAIISEEGWTKPALGKMRKIDSFLKESQRFNGLRATSMERIIVKPGGYTFSNGVTVPQGTFVAVAMDAMHHDTYGREADVFDGFRYANMRAEEGEGVKHQMVSTSPDYLTFGHGRHACPGRFFAANELKAMLAHVLLTYDVKFQDEGIRPPNEWYSANCVPNLKAQVMFRKRQSVDH